MPPCILLYFVFPYLGDSGDATCKISAVVWMETLLSLSFAAATLFSAASTLTVSFGVTALANLNSNSADSTSFSNMCRFIRDFILSLHNNIKLLYRTRCWLVNIPKFADNIVYSRINCLYSSFTAGNHGALPPTMRRRVCLLLRSPRRRVFFLPPVEQAGSLFETHWIAF